MLYYNNNMRFIITYTDYKYEEIHNLIINHSFNVKSEDQSSPVLLRKYNPFIFTRDKVTLSYNVATDIHKYQDDLGNNNYKINLIPLINNSSKGKIMRVINNICGALFVNVLESDIEHHKLNVRMDEDILEKYDCATIPRSGNIYIQIYDKQSIFDKILLMK